MNPHLKKLSVQRCVLSAWFLVLMVQAGLIERHPEVCFMVFLWMYV